MRVAVIGLGYVGATLAGCLASEGHEVWAVERDTKRAAAVRAGEWPHEQELGARLREASTLHVGSDMFAAMQAAEVIFVCVGTPSNLLGNLNILDTLQVSETIGKVLVSGQTVVYRSTMEPGTMRDAVIPVLEGNSQMKAGVDFAVLYMPEFLREGSAVRDFYNPPFMVFGYANGPANVAGALKMQNLFQCVLANTIKTTLEDAEMLKLTCNAWHALKVAFANEIGAVCQAVGASSAVVMDVFAEDTQLNISRAYLRPGWAYGGACLPKDVQCLAAMAKARGIWPTLITAIDCSNQNIIETASQAITNLKPRKVGLVGLAHKAGTGDLRGSATLELARQLRHCGVEVVEQDQPDAAALQDCDVVVLANRDAVPLLEAGALPPDVLLVDLAHICTPGPNVVRLT